MPAHEGSLPAFDITSLCQLRLLNLFFVLIELKLRELKGEVGGMALLSFAFGEGRRPLKVLLPVERRTAAETVILHQSLNGVKPRGADYTNARAVGMMVR